jgi:hypothetical protein
MLILTPHVEENGGRFYPSAVLEERTEYGARRHVYPLAPKVTRAEALASAQALVRNVARLHAGLLVLRVTGAK